MVMPRWRSSGALSIWSNADAWFRVGYLSCSTLVIAAVSVVLPWSMCPMVPMLTCGLVRSNLALATGAPSGFLASRSRGVDGILVCADRGVPVNSGAGDRPSQNGSCSHCSPQGLEVASLPRPPARAARSARRTRCARPVTKRASSLPACLLDDLVGDRLRRLGVGVELHRVGRLA